MGAESGTAAGRPEGRPRVAVVIPTWNDSKMTLACVRTVQDSAYPVAKIIVVDDGSTPPVAPGIEAAAPEVDAVSLPRNSGFTGACNRGLEHALGTGAEYILLLNNDTLVDREAVGLLVDAMEEDPKAGLASALLLYPGEEKRVQFYRATLDRATARHRCADDGQPWAPAYDATTDTEFAPGCAVLLRTETLRDVGLFDESLHTNWEDYDLCVRLADAGWAMLTVGRAHVVHAHGKTQGRTSPFTTYFFTRNRLICLFRHAPVGVILKRSLFILRTFYWQMRNFGFTNAPAQAAFFKGFLFFLLGARGKQGAPRNRRDRPAAKPS